MSNDWNAITALSRRGVALPAPVLRSFDLLVFGVQCGAITVADGEAARDALKREVTEWLPKEFKNSSFEDGIAAFCPRLLGCDKPPLGQISPGAAGVEQLLLISIP